MKHNLKWLEATLTDAIYQLVPNHPETKVVDWEQIIVALAELKRELRERLGSCTGERAKKCWRSDHKFIREILGEGDS